MSFFDRLFGNLTEEERAERKFQQDPVGASQQSIGDVQQMLTGAFKRSTGPGLEQALSLLDTKGAEQGNETSLGLRDIETQRQLLQQDITQRSAQGGLAGAFATQALKDQGNLAAENASARFEEDQAFAQDLRRRQDISGIFNSLTGPGHTLLGSKRPGIEDTTPSTLQSALQLGGNILGAWNQFKSLKGGS